jgi:hypothetical protein
MKCFNFVCSLIFTLLPLITSASVNRRPEGIVAKHATAPYVGDREKTTCFKILNREYSQKQGREELFERERHKEPGPGWHRCAIACAESEMSA